MVVVYDIETLINYFLYVAYDIKDKKTYIYEISDLKDDSKELFKHLKEVKGQIGFNNINFDAQVIEYLLKHPDAKAEELHDFAMLAIERSNNREFPEFKTFSISQLDLMRIWHYDNEARMTSLKFLQFSMDWHNIEDMPLGHKDPIKDRQTADQVIKYCINDVMSTHNFYLITKGETDHPLFKNVDKIQLRKNIQKEFKINCINFSDVKIGDEINKVSYLNKTGKKFNDIRFNNKVRRNYTFEDCFPKYISFKTKEFNDFIDSIRKVVITKDKQEFLFKYNKTEYLIAKGGIHSSDKPRVITVNSNQVLRDADIGSQYPWSIIKRKLYPSHLGEEWLEVYTDIFHKRIAAKKKYKETKDTFYQAIQESYKLLLNGSFGKLGSETSWQYDPYVLSCVTIGNQMDILMLIESLELKGISVVSANTDGILSYYDKSLEQEYKDTCKEWEKQVGNDQWGNLEFKDYKAFAQIAVNDYIAVLADHEIKSEKDEKTKTKGDFLTNHELHKNKSFRIIPLALEQYYYKGINPVMFILNHTNIFDFCGVARAKGNWWFEMRGIENGKYISKKLQKTNRYYISKKGYKLIKVNPDGREIQQDAGKWLCKDLNVYEERDYEIDYNFYINATYDIINKIQPEVTKLFTQLSMF